MLGLANLLELKSLFEIEGYDRPNCSVLLLGQVSLGSVQQNCPLEDLPHP